MSTTKWVPHNVTGEYVQAAILTTSDQIGNLYFYSCYNKVFTQGIEVSMVKNNTGDTCS